MASIASLRDDRIMLHFAWIGSNAWHESNPDNSDIRVIDLLFNNTKTEVSVDLPEKVNAAAFQKFPFTCRKYQETEEKIGGLLVRPLEKETHPSSLYVAIEQIYDLVIRVGVFVKGNSIGPTTTDPITGKIFQQQVVQKTDKDIKLEMLKPLEKGRSYLLLVSSHNRVISAHLIEESNYDEIKKEGQQKHFLS